MLLVELASAVEGDTEAVPLPSALYVIVALKTKSITPKVSVRYLCVNLLMVNFLDIFKPHIDNVGSLTNCTLFIY